ncbi:hypothetical protein QUF94_27510 [Peribacillus sp. NJ4]|nr:hypothetical protein [Peribacillus sp. NJ4]MDM5215070.1 hypothetical protein [Peribacillus sp. NJ4]
MAVHDYQTVNIDILQKLLKTI